MKCSQCDNEIPCKEHGSIPDTLVKLCRENHYTKMRDRNYISEEELEEIRKRIEKRQETVQKDLETFEYPSWMEGYKGLIK